MNVCEWPQATAFTCRTHPHNLPHTHTHTSLIQKQNFPSLKKKAKIIYDPLHFANSGILTP